MKTSRAFACAATALLIGFFAARWCPAESSKQPEHKEPANYDFGALGQLKSLITFLQDNKQTNIHQRFNAFLTASQASRNYADLGVTLAILERLRNGRTNQAYELLEGRLNADIIEFVASYRELPDLARDEPGLSLLGQAKDYRTRHPFKSRYATVDESVGDSFKVLNGK